MSAAAYRKLVGAPADTQAEMDAASYRRLMGETANDLVPEAKPRSKYGNVKTEIDGHRFDSLAEARHYETLKLLVSAGAIDDLVLQPRFPLMVNGQKICTYVGDFSFYDTTRKVRVVQDVKGMRTDVYRLKVKLMRAVLGIDVEEVR